ncbi:hypothetical protein DDE23_22105 [Pararhodobacter aggregans]|uniref:Uncharacterized protein n=1 Tax=Pararhodobacter aggregans TaxID=404875 RepID=A0A2T7UKS3_9RHOB|nr:hypothetical protein DDE23_22105 [Pararhodobacter aggregans]
MCGAERADQLTWPHDPARSHRPKPAPRRLARRRNGGRGRAGGAAGRGPRRAAGRLSRHGPRPQGRGRGALPLGADGRAAGPQPGARLAADPFPERLSPRRGPAAPAAASASPRPCRAARPAR